jgi:Zn-dependent peptidase ImmA (M78 family)/DNA-binding XRE family transcriptional regulator
MTDLANLLDLTRQAISGFERGVDSPSNETISRLSLVLSMPREFFSYETDPDIEVDGPIFHRSMVTALKKNKERSNVFATWMAGAFKEMSSRLEIPPSRLPDLGVKDFEALNDDDIAILANQCRKQLGLGLGPISNLTALMENHGIPVCRMSLPEKVDAFSYTTKGKQTFVILDRNVSTVRHRFSLAHELAHLMLHRSLQSDFMEDKDLFTLVEHQANVFASEFLFPLEVFQREFSDLRGSSLLHLKKRWKVSNATICRKAKDNSLITEHQAQYYYRSNSKHRKIEPLDNEIPPEVPSYLNKVLTVLDKHRIVIKEQLTSLVPLPLSVLAEIFEMPQEAFSGSCSGSNVLSFNLRSASAGS